MISQLAKQDRNLLMLTILTLMALVILAAAVPGSAGAAPDYSEYLEMMAEDIEDIHHDMHKVVYNLRLMSYAGIGIFLALLGHTMVTFMNGKK